MAKPNTPAASLRYMEDIDPVLFAVPTSPLVAGQLRKMLAKRYNYEGCGVMTVLEYIRFRKPDYKSTYAQHYSDKRVHMVYRKLDPPKMHYNIWWHDGTRYVGMAVPKVVYDALNLPENPL